MSESTGDLSQNSFPTTLAAILNFCMNAKSLSPKPRELSDFGEIFDPQGICLFYPLEASGDS